MIPARVLGVPFVIMTLLGLYMAFTADGSGAYFIVIGVLVLVATYVFEPAINWWWWNKYPPDLDNELTTLLEKKSVQYNALTAEQQREVRKRLFFFRKAHNFMPQGMEQSPDDVEIMIGLAPIIMTLHQEEYQFEHFENIVLYAHPFPSPQYETEFHASEIYEPDGVAMFCTSHIVRGFMQPDLYLNPAWYEYAKIFMRTYPGILPSNISAVTWEQLQQISSFPEEALQRWIGLKDLDKTAITFAYYFLFPKKFRQVLPEQANQLSSIFYELP